jgi:hypothetical protein
LEAIKGHKTIQEIALQHAYQPSNYVKEAGG